VGRLDFAEFGDDRTDVAAGVRQNRAALECDDLHHPGEQVGQR